MDFPGKTLDRWRGGLFSRGILNNARFDLTRIPMAAVYNDFDCVQVADTLRGGVAVQIDR